MKYHQLVAGVVTLWCFGCAGAVQPRENRGLPYQKELELAAKTLASKMDTFQMVGGIEYETSYNGTEPDGCEYAGVKKTLLGAQESYNFKSCRGQISYVGKTGVEGLTREVKERFNASRQRFETICKRQGQARIELNEFTFKCFSSPNSPDSYKWVVLKEGKMIP